MRMRLLIGRSAITIPKGWKGNLHCCGVCLHSKTVLYFMFCCVLVPFFYILSERDVSVALSGVADDHSNVAGPSGFVQKSVQSGRRWQ